MTFDAREVSSEAGEPILLAVFALGAKTWRFAQADDDVTVGGHTYLGVQMGISEIRQSGQMPRNDITMVVDRDHPIAELYRVSPPVGTVAVILKEFHETDGELATSWLGHVSNVHWVSSAKAEITLAPGIVAMKGVGLRRPWQVGCPHVLFSIGDGLCNVDRELYRTAATVSANSGNLLSAAAFGSYAGAASLAGGFIEWVDVDGVTDWRYILSHSGSEVRLLSPAPTLAVTDAFDFFPGCDRTIGAKGCSAFANTPNYGGFPYFTDRNPFDGQPVY